MSTIVSLRQFDINVSGAGRFGTGDFFSNIPRLSRVPAVKLLMVSDTLEAHNIVDGFRRVARPPSEQSPGARAYQAQYTDFLGRVARQVRFLNTYLIMDTHLDSFGLAQVLSTYGLGADPVQDMIPQPFTRGRDAWNRVICDDGSQWAVLRSKIHQSGEVFPRILHRLFGLDFPIWAVLYLYTFPETDTQRLLRQKGVEAKYSHQQAQGDAREEASYMMGSVAGIRYDISRYGAALHAVRLYVVAGGATDREMNRRLDLVQGALSLDMERAPVQVLRKILSTDIYADSDGAAATTPGVAILAGSALSYRRRTETQGVLLGTDRNQSPVIFNFFSDNNPSYNAVVLGLSGSGKTFATLTMMLRHMLLGTRLVIIDPQGNIDLQFLTSYHRSILGTEQAAINVLDITRGTLTDQIASVKHTLLMLGVLRAGDQLAAAVLDQVLMDIYLPLWSDWERGSTVTVPTLSACQQRLVQIANNTDEPAEIRQAANGLAFLLTQYVSGSLADLFGRETSVDFSLDDDVTVFDVSRLPDQTMGGNLRAALLAILVGNVSQAIRRRRRVLRDTRPILFFVDEMGILMRDPVVASYVSAEYKTARARRVGMIVADQDLHSLLGPRDEHGIHHGVPILANAATTFIFKQKGSELPTVREHFPDIPPGMLDKLPGLRTGTCVAQFQDDLLEVYVQPSELDQIVLSSRLEDRQLAKDTIKRLLEETS